MKRQNSKQSPANVQPEPAKPVKANQPKISTKESTIKLESNGSIKKRESKKYQKSPEEDPQARLLELYNDLKTIQDNKELPNRQVYLRRIGLELVKYKPDLYQFPIL